MAAGMQGGALGAGSDPAPAGTNFVLYHYILHLQTATQQVRSELERSLSEVRAEMECYVETALREQRLLSPPNFPQRGHLDVEFGTLWARISEEAPHAGVSGVPACPLGTGSSVSTTAVGTSVRSSLVSTVVAAEAERPIEGCRGSGGSAPEGCGGGSLAAAAAVALVQGSPGKHGAPSLGAGQESPAKRLRTHQEEEAVPPRKDSGEAARARALRQNLAGAPSPCRAMRSGLMASSPPRKPPPEQPAARELPAVSLWEQPAAREEQPAVREEPPAMREWEEPPPRPVSPVGSGEVTPPPAARFVAPAAFAMASTRAAVTAEECPPSPASPHDFSQPNVRSALFAPPPSSPTGGCEAPKASLPPAAALPAAVLPPASALPMLPPAAVLPPAAAPVAVLPPAAALEAAEGEVAGAATPQVGGGEATPLPVSQRIMLFETKSTPNLGRPGDAQQRGSSARAGAAAPLGSGSAVNGNSMFTPLRSSAGGGVKPKELFRSHSEFSQRTQEQLRPKAAVGRTASQGTRVVRPPTGPGGSLVPGPPPSERSFESSLDRSARAGERVEAFERLAAGGRQEVAKPKSLKAAEMAKREEERRLREKQLRGFGALSGSASVPASAPGSARKATPLAERAVDVASEEPEQRAVRFPPVPSFGPEPHELLRRTELGPKREEDNYEISEHGQDSDDEERSAQRRSLKHVPKWCEGYLADLQKQEDVDPDTIFAAKVPRCDLAVIFDEALYQSVGKMRPRRARGSSGDWRKDRLTAAEIRGYKARMGQSRSWNAPAPEAAS